jgi:hypothetical protein
MAVSDLLNDRLRQMRPRAAAVSLNDNPRVLDITRLTMVEHADLPAMGITLVGSPSTQIFTTEIGKSVGSIRIESRGTHSVIIIDNGHRGGRINANLRISESGCTCAFSTPDYGVASLGIISLRSPDQSFYWGHGATAVGLSVEIEGQGRSVMIGDDALISSGVWIRNHDMHSVVDLNINQVTNINPVDTIVEPHIWIGQDVLLLNCERIGYGSILAAKSLIRGTVPPTSAVGGVPGRVLRSDISWGRGLTGMSPREQQLIHTLKTRLSR